MINNTTDFPLPPVDDGPIFELLWTRHALPVAALAQEVGLFERAAEQAITIADTAAHLRVTHRAAEAMIAVVAALGFLQHQDNGRFTLTPLGQSYLTESSPFYYGPLMPADAPPLVELRQAFHQSGEPTRPTAVAIDQLSGAEIRGFIDQMHKITFPASGALAQQAVFTGIRQLLDVGGGSGTLSMAIAARHPQIQCTILDLEPVCAIAREKIAANGLAERVTTMTADMLTDTWPSGFDAILFGNIFHDWDANTCRQLASHAYDALAPGGFILLHEIPLNDNKDGPLMAACFSVSMLIHEKGKQYTMPELADILTGAGFTAFQSVPTFGYYHFVQAKKVD